MIEQTIYRLIDNAVNIGFMDKQDVIYTRNRLIELLRLPGWNFDGSLMETNDASLEGLLAELDEILAYARQQGLIDESQWQADIFEAKVMDRLMPRPSEVNQHFWELYEHNPSRATNYFYKFSQLSNYIKTREIAKNQYFKAESPYGQLEITINLSRPEKDPKEIALAASQPQAGYPRCALCMENEGYEGSINQAARANHRVIRIPLQNGTYGFQYSPYLYYNEHSIFFNEHHVPMVIDRGTFENLVELVERFPHYFVGSNADLPRVGGSILVHDHYQGGNHNFAMANAMIRREFNLNGHPQVKAGLVHWPMSVIRLQSTSQVALVNAAEHILAVWRSYSDPTLEILAYTTEPHNTVTPIARFREGEYELDLVLRNNRTTELHPEGIFHPHRDVHHIKKENIGLIEVMGLAILPPRLIEELQAVGDYLQGKVPLEIVAKMHQPWAESMLQAFGTVDAQHLQQVIQSQLAQKFSRVLEDAGVFKLDDTGQAGFERFIESVKEA